MSKPTTNRKRVETWNTRTGPIVKVAVRVRAGATGGNRPGTFHGATNFVLGQAGSGVQA